MSAPPIHIDHSAVVNPAIASFQGINNAEKTILIPSGDILMAIIKSQNESLQSLKKSLLSFNKQEASDLINSFGTEYYSVMNDIEEFVLRFEEDGATAFGLEVRLLAWQLLSNHMLVLNISEGEEVDEDSTEYGNFIAEMAKEAISEKKPTYGRKALFDLLND